LRTWEKTKRKLKGKKMGKTLSTLPGSLLGSLPSRLGLCWPEQYTKVLGNKRFLKTNNGSVRFYVKKGPELPERKIQKSRRKKEYRERQGEMSRNLTAGDTEYKWKCGEKVGSKTCVEAYDVYALCIPLSAASTWNFRKKSALPFNAFVS
jgi:hypothetical protein